MGRKVTVAYEDNRKGRALAKHAADYDAAVARCLQVMGRAEPGKDVERSRSELDRFRAAGVSPQTAAAIISSTLHHSHPPHTKLDEGAKESAAESYWVHYRVETARGRGTRTKGPYHTADHAIRVRDEFRAEGHHDVWITHGEHGHAYAEGASESPTNSEWEVVVTHPPRAHRGAILNMVPPGDARSEGDKIILAGFYDDDEAMHVANAISRRYRSQVTFGPKSTFGTNEENANVAAEEHRRPNAPPKEEPCEHGCPTGACKPFSKVTRDPVAFEACMARAKEIGTLQNPINVFRLVSRDIATFDEEHLMVVCIDFRGQLRDWFVVAMGQRHKVAVDTEDVLAGVILSKCDGFIMLHNHPSGDPTPSRADGKLTKTIRKAAEIACPNILMNDHLVCGLNSFYSFEEGKIIKVKS